MARAQPGRVAHAGTHPGRELGKRFRAFEGSGVRGNCGQRVEDVLADRFLAPGVGLDDLAAQAVAAGLEAVEAVDEVRGTGRLLPSLREVIRGDGLRITREVR